MDGLRTTAETAPNSPPMICPDCGLPLVKVWVADEADGTYYGVWECGCRKPESED